MASPAPAGASTPDAFPVLLPGQTLLAWRRQQLAQGGDPADLDWLLDLAGGVAWPDLQLLRLQPERQVPLRCTLVELETLWHQHRSSGEPLQYLLGRCPWRDLELRVAPGVLIPRQETELLVELALTATEGGSPSPRLWADLGTGSGCLALALALAWSSSRGLAVDRSPQALIQAAQNLQLAGVADRVRLLQGDWWHPLQPWWGRLELVVSNPPYIPSATVDHLDPRVRDHEPRLALDGGDDGLKAIRAILALAPQALAPDGLLLLEHHHDQSAAVLALMAEHGLREPRAHRDLEGNHRFATARR